MIALHHLEGAAPREVAEQLERLPSTIRSQATRGRTLLREAPRGRGLT